MNLGKYSFGIGDRFNHEGAAQLSAIVEANNEGINITPVWNKSNREHDIVNSEPEGTRKEADTAVKESGWKGNYFVDADHINLKNVGRFIEHSDFFTLDVAEYIGKKSPEENIKSFKESCKTLGDRIDIEGIGNSVSIDEELLDLVANKYLAAVKQAGKIYRHIEKAKGKGNFITEISMDEVEEPQTPVEMFFILKMIADEKIPVQTLAPKFTGRFNKGVDYKGDIKQFAKEFEQDILVIDYAIGHFGLPEDLKLSVHSGSDKFSIYPVMAEVLKKYNKGIHIKTAGTTWLEEVIGLAISGDEGLTLAKEIYIQALDRKEELCRPYADVIDIDESQLPSPDEVSGWNGDKFAGTLRHIPGHPDYNPNFRQLIHVAYKVAAEMGDTYIHLLEKNSKVIRDCVKENILKRHLSRLFEFLLTLSR
ncbi:MAG: hypothetical protein DSY82_06580 [Flavobacteriia bacterium]|nr:MAG: hypothetical protein DSY82_06580 [Flavobacteriia bacterium]